MHFLLFLGERSGRWLTGADVEESVSGPEAFSTGCFGVIRANVARSQFLTDNLLVRAQGEPVPHGTISSRGRVTGNSLSVTHFCNVGFFL